MEAAMLVRTLFLVATGTLAVMAGIPAAQAGGPHHNGYGGDRGYGGRNDGYDRPRWRPQPHSYHHWRPQGYYAPPRAYYVPPQVYYAPPRAYYAPPPVYYAPQPYAYVPAPSLYFGFGVR